MNKPNDWTLTSDLQTGSDLEITIVWFYVEVLDSIMEPLQLWQHLINKIIFDYVRTLFFRPYLSFFVAFILFALFIHVKHLHKCWN